MTVCTSNIQLNETEREIHLTGWHWCKGEMKYNRRWREMTFIMISEYRLRDIKTIYIEHGVSFEKGALSYTKQRLSLRQIVQRDRGEMRWAMSLRRFLFLTSQLV